MKINSLKFLLAAMIAMALFLPKKAFSQVVFTGLPGNSPIYLTQGATNDVVFGFSVTVPAFGNFTPGPLHIAQSSGTNGFISGNLVRTTAATPSLAVTAPQASYGANINGTIDINGFPNLSGGFGGTTYYFYLVLSITNTANPPPASVIFSLPASGSITQNGYGGGITINNLASPTTYYFGVNQPTVSSTSTCGPGSVTLTANDSSPSGGTYKWYTAASGGTLLQSSTATTYTASISASTTYYVSYTYGTQTSARTAVTSVVNTAPSSAFSGPATAVTGGNVAITYTGGDPSTSAYSWNFNSGTIISGSGQGPYSIQWSTSGIKTVTLSVTNAAGCTSTVTSQTVNVQPIVAPTATNGANCGPGTVLLTASGGSPAGGTYNWYAASSGGTALLSSSATTYSPTVMATKNYYVSYTVSGVESTRTPVTATINPIVASPVSGALFSYPFNGNMNDISGNANNGYTTISPSLTTDRFGATNSAYNFNGSTQYISQTSSTAAPTTFTISLWFNTSVGGGKLLGFGNSQTGASTTAYDRNLYMSNSGQIYFGTFSGSAFLTANTTASYSDGNWHHVVVTVGPSDGTTIYVDGTVQGSNASEVAGYNMTGYWRIGYDQISSTFYTGAPTNPYFTGKLDDIAVYNTELSAAQITATNSLNQIAATTTSVCASSPISFSAPLITGATYTWTDASGVTQTGQNPTFPAAVAGSYTLSVTGGPGGCSSTATITPIITTASATFTATATVLQGSNATVTYTGTESAASTYNWNFNGGTIISGSGQGPYQVSWPASGAKTITLTVISAATGCSGTSSQPVNVTSNAAWYSNYVYREKITLSKSLVQGNTDLSNFPVLVKVVDPNLIYTVGQGTCINKIQSPTLADLAFTDGYSGQTTELPYQIDTYDNTTGTLWVWVKVPTLAASGSATAASVINMYYGSTAPPVAHNTAYQQTTWNGATAANVNYNGVWHFNEAVSTSTYSVVDGTSAGNNLIAYTNLVTNTTSSQIGKGVKFASSTGVGGNLSTSTTVTNYPVNGQPVTVSYWYNSPNIPGTGAPQTNPTQNGMVLTAPNGSSPVLIQLGFTNAVLETWPSGGRGNPFASSASTPAAGTWHYYVYTFDGTKNAMYIDGVAQSASTSVTPLNQAANKYNQLMFGDFPNDTYSEEFDGNIDEAHFINTALSQSWVQTEYANQLNPTNLGTAPFISALGSIEYNMANFNAGYSPGSMVYSWVGTTTNVATAANWNITSVTPTVTGQAPGSIYASINLPGGASAYPQLTAALTVFSASLAAGSTFTLNGYSLNVACDITNTGGQIVYGSTSTAGGITWNGARTIQYYYGSASGIINIANMTVSSTVSGTVNLTGGPFGINNVLTLTQGNLFVDNANSGSLTLMSGAANTASVAAIPAAYSITGNVNVQRFLSNGAGTRGYRLLTSPVNISLSKTGTGNLSLAYLNTSSTFGSTTYNGAFTQGPGTGFTTNGSTNPIIYLYDESRPTNNTSFVSGKNVGVYSITGSSGSPAYSVTTINGIPPTNTAGVSVPVGNSFIFYFVGSNQSTTVASTRVPDATTLTATGYLNQGNVPVIFWKTNSTTVPYHVTTGTTNYGLNQVGNPYPSTISLNTLYTDNYNATTNPINAIFYELIPGGNYVTYSAANGHVSDSRASQYIQSGQGFLMQATGTTPAETLTFKEDQKVAYNSASTMLLSIPASPASAKNVNSIPAAGKTADQLNVSSLPPAATGESNSLHLQLSRDSANYAQTGIYFSTSASDKFVEREDAVQIDGGTPVVYLSSYSSDNVKLAINTLSDYALGKRIRLYVYANASLNYNFTMPDISGIDTVNYNAYLVDNQKNDSVDMVKTKTYPVAINLADTTSFGANRFVFALEHKTVGQYALTTFSGEKIQAGVQLNWTATNAGNYTGYTLQKQNSSGGYDSLYNVQSSADLAAYNYIDMHPALGNNVYRLKQNGITGAITYSQLVTIGYNSTTPNGAMNIYPNPASSVINVSLASNTINATYLAETFNSQGNLVKRETVNGQKWADDVSAYQMGLYVVRVKDNNGNIIGQSKFVKVQ